MYQRWYNRQVEVAFELSLERERREHAKTKELLQRTRASVLAYQDAERAAREYNRKDQARATGAGKYTRPKHVLLDGVPGALEGLMDLGAE